MTYCAKVWKMLRNLSICFQLLDMFLIHILDYKKLQQIITINDIRINDTVLALPFVTETS